MTLPFTQIRCLLSTLGPLHLGMGKDYLPTQYVIQNGYLHAFGDQQLAKGLGSEGLRSLLSIVEKGDESALREIQREIHLKADQLVPLATHSVWASPGVCDLYENRIGQVAQKESRRNIHHQLEIRRMAANPYDQCPTLTGSAVKGAIRTAWLDTLNDGRPASPDEKSLSMQRRLLGTGVRVEEDPFYLLKISDASYAHAEGLMPGEILFAVSRKRRPRPDRPPSNLNTLLECVGPWRDRCFAFDMRFLSGALRKTSVCVPGSREDVAQACNRYYLPLLKRELTQLNEAGYLQSAWVETWRSLISGELGKALSGNRAFLLRLGKHSGAEDKTLNGVRQIKILGKNKQPPTIRTETTEVRLAAKFRDAQKDMLPFGWVLVEFDDHPLEATRSLIRDQASAARARMNQEQQWRLHREQERRAHAAE